MSIIDAFLTDIDTLISEFIQNFDTSVKETRSLSQLAKAVSQLDFYQELKALGFEDRLLNLNQVYDDRFEELYRIAERAGVRGITTDKINDIELVARLDTQRLLRRAQDWGDEFKSALLKQVVTGQSIQDVTNDILPRIQQNVEYNTSWFKSAMNTAYSEFNAYSTMMLFEDEPDAKFRLKHVLDTRTRCQCRNAITIQKQKYPDGLTIKQINSGALNSKCNGKEWDYNFVWRGGFNCRGEFIPNLDYLDED